MRRSADPPPPGVPAPGPPGGRVGATGLRPDQLRWLMAGLLIGLFLSSTEQSVVATALPTMAGELGSANRIAWVVSAYLLTSTVTTPLYGKMSDIFGRRIVYQTSIAIFVLGSMLCALSQDMNQLVGARAVQGCGGGGLMSLAFVIVGDVVSPRERGRYIGVFTAVFTFSAVTGPLWGGVLVDTAGWRWVFWAVVPFGLLGLVVTNRGLRLPFSTRERVIDWPGIALLVVASTCLILVPIWGGETFAWTDWRLWATGAVGLVASAAFVLVERVAREPIIPMRLFGNRTVAVVFAMGFGMMASLIAVSTFMPLFLQVATGASATRSGLLLTPQSIGVSLIATVSGFLVSRSGRYKWTVIAGPLVGAAALMLLSRISPETTALRLSPVLFLLGSGLGLAFPNLTLSVQNASPVEDLGVATSTANFFRSVGAAFGAALAGAFLSAHLDRELADRLGPARLAELGGTDGLIRSPRVIAALPDELQTVVAATVTDSVTALIAWTVPIMLGVFALAFLIQEIPLRTTSTISANMADHE
jgi:EmrB/QacA subfamily drug resistance transporter